MIVFLLVIIVLVSLGVYFNALYDGFTYDDLYQVVQNEGIKDIKYLPEVFSRSVWGFVETKIGKRPDNYYRPLMYVSYMAAYYVFGLKPWGFHLLNIVIHAGVSILVFLITNRLFQDAGFSGQPYSRGWSWTRYPPLIGVLLFATHPIHTEAVTWIAGLPEPGFALFGLLSFYLYIRAADGSGRSAVFSLVFFSLSLLYKETAITLPLLFASYDYSFRKKNVLAFDQLKRYALYWLVSGIYLIVRFYILGNFAPAKRYVSLTTWQYFVNIFPLFVQYMEKLILPVNLCAFHLFYPILSVFEMRGLISCAVVASFIVLLGIIMKKAKPVFFGFTLIFVPLLPVFYIRGLGTNVFAERYLYLPSFGFIFLVALAIGWAQENKPRASVAIASICIAIIGIYAAGTISRNPVWKDNYVLYDDIIKKEPPFAEYALMSLTAEAADFLQKGQINAAISDLRYLIHMKPDYADAHAKLGFAYEKLGLTDSAIEQLQIAARLAPASADIHTDLGNALFAKGWIDEAIKQYKLVLTLNPTLGDAYYDLALAYEQKGSINEAIRNLEIAVKLNPASITIRDELDRANALKGGK
jgi:protein O-mannosyl-transferase